MAAPAAPQSFPPADVFPSACSLGCAVSSPMSSVPRRCSLPRDGLQRRYQPDLLRSCQRQGVDPVSSRLQLRDQSRPDKSLRPAHENVHAPPPYASVSCTHMVTTAQPQNRMNSPTLLCPPNNPETRMPLRASPWGRWRCDLRVRPSSDISSMTAST